MTYEWFGVVGLPCLVVAWIPQTLRTMRTKKTNMEPRFLWLYFIGSVLLTLYAAYVWDLVFMGLNSIAALFDLINLYYYYVYESKTKRRAKGKLKRSG